MAFVIAYAGALPFRPWTGRLVALAGRWVRRACHVLLAAIGQATEGEGARVPTEELIQRFQRGQTRAFEALYDRYKDYVYRVAFYTTRNSGDAEEAVQETFLDVLRALDHYRTDGPARFETWLYRVTVNRCRSLMRRKRPASADWEWIVERLERIPSPHREGDPEANLLRGERAAALWQAVDALPESQRMVVFMRYRENLSYEEIAQVLGIKLGTVKSRLYYAHRALREQLVVDEELVGAEAGV
jgi:RNA polymerase sigma-70 factor (ECF subfamily)